MVCAAIASLSLDARTALAQQVGGGAPSPGSAPPTPREHEPVALGGASRGSQSVRAIAHYERGRVHYASGRYRAAIAELEAALQLNPNLTDLDYNLGLVYERLGRLDDALRAYQRYERSTTDQVERERTQRIIARIVGARTEPLEFVWGGGRLGRADALFWSFTGVGLASVAVAGVSLAIGIVEQSRAESLLRMGDNGGARATRDGATAGFVTSATMFSLAVGFGAAAGLLYATRPAGAPPTLNGLCLSVGPTEIGIRGSF